MDYYDLGIYQKHFLNFKLIIFFLCLFGFWLGHSHTIYAQDKKEKRSPTLGLEQGYLEFDTPQFNLKLVRASQTVAALSPKSAHDFDFTPSDWLEKRNASGFFQLGDLNLRLRAGTSGEWQYYSTAKNRNPVDTLKTIASSILSAADLSSTLSTDIPLHVTRTWSIENGKLALHFRLENTSDQPVQIGSLGIPMVFNNILSGKSLEEAHAHCSFYDPYIGQDAGYLQVTRLNGHGPALLVVPDSRTPFEAYRPLLSDPTPRGITFEGFYEWMVHTKAYAENEWKSAEPWNSPTSEILKPGESRTYGVKFILSDSIPDIEHTLSENNRPVAIGIPGYVLPMDQDAQLFLKYGSNIKSIDVAPKNSIQFTQNGTTKHGWKKIRLRGQIWGRSRLTVTYQDGLTQTINYKVIKPEKQVADDLGHFLLTQQWFDKPNDPFHRNPSVISYDFIAHQQVTEDRRVWIAGLSDEGGAGSWLAAMMKQLIDPDPQQVDLLETFVDSVMWGHLQYNSGNHKYGVRKSLFYYAPDSLPEDTYNSNVHYGGWESWNRKQARSVGRSYDYPHVAAAYWTLYRLARNHTGLATHHSWQWYLNQAYETSQAMVKYAGHYAQFGQMEGTVFVMILRDMQREGWSKRAAALKATMKKRAEHWKSLPFPFGSEMPWDSTGQEEVYAWCRFFGFDQKAEVTLRAILGYMPTVPHWGYNGSARRYWDFMFAGKLSRLERQLHHYGSGLNAIPVLTEYRSHPDNTYLLRVGYGGLTGSISNITQEGFGPCGFHAYPSTLRIDGYSGDYGPNFFGHAINTGTYIINHPEFGWLAFGGNVSQHDNQVSIRILDSSHSRVYIASLGLWLTLDSGRFHNVTIDPNTHNVQITLNKATGYTQNARIHIEQPAQTEGIGNYQPINTFSLERDAYVIPLSKTNTVVTLSPK